MYALETTFPMLNQHVPVCGNSMKFLYHVSRLVWVENVDIAHDNQGKTLLRLQKSGCSGVEANVAIMPCLSMYQCSCPPYFFQGSVCGVNVLCRLNCQQVMR